MGFTKSDLKTGMVCKHRDGRFSLVAKDTFEKEDNLVFVYNNRTDLRYFKEDTLKWYPPTTRNRDERTEFQKSIDIVEVYQPINLCNGYIIISKHYSQINTSKWKLLWKEEPEVEEMTMEEVCRMLGKNIKIIK